MSSSWYVIQQSMWGKRLWQVVYRADPKWAVVSEHETEDEAKKALAAMLDDQRKAFESIMLPAGPSQVNGDAREEAEAGQGGLE